MENTKMLTFYEANYFSQHLNENYYNTTKIKTQRQSKFLYTTV